ncbi:hypothetical protein ScalyP_jg272 [Parmales sp. scaly parma]|nr:hypothetical protein ScalyP_jg272 [Parmales sp. scaly parma]
MRECCAKRSLFDDEHHDVNCNADRRSQADKMLSMGSGDARSNAVCSGIKKVYDHFAAVCVAILQIK